MNHILVEESSISKCYVDSLFMKKPQGNLFEQGITLPKDVKWKCYISTLQLSKSLIFVLPQIHIDVADIFYAKSNSISHQAAKKLVNESLSSGKDRTEPIPSSITNSGDESWCLFILNS